MRRISSAARRLIHRAGGLTGRAAVRPTEGIRDLSGDRDVEWAWACAHIPNGPGTALDFGSGGSNLGLVAMMRGFEVTLLDRQEVSSPYQSDAISFWRGDILDIEIPSNAYDLIINCSSVEHVGLAGRYGVTSSRQDGDLIAMSRLLAGLKPQGRQILTVPVGVDSVFSPYHRVYGMNRLPLLLRGYSVTTESYWAKDASNRWRPIEANEAMASEPVDPRTMALYALGLFVLGTGLA